MKKTEFKVLVYCGQYVDFNLLSKGIYTCEVPRLFDASETIATIDKAAKLYKDLTGLTFLPDAYFDNLNKCQLVDVTLEFK